MNGTVEDLLTAWARAAFTQAFPDADLGDVRMDVVPANDERYGDYQCNAAMPLAKTLRMKPRDIAQAAVDAIPLPPSIDKVDLAGPGFINFHLNSEWLGRCMEALPDDDRAGMPLPKNPDTIVLDYAGPNIAKPMHIGHLRPCVIGRAVDRILRFAGHHVISDNHLGDWGTQFGLLILGYRNLLDEAALEEDPVSELERLYVESSRRAQEDEDWKNQARAELVKLQQGDPENRKAWSRFLELSMDAFHHTFERLGVVFDHERGESYYNDILPGVVDGLVEKGIARESEGALIVDLEEEDLKVCMVRKSDGGFNYASTDIATIVSRMDEFKPDRIVYVTDERQQLHFKQVFRISELLGYDVDLVHVGFGLMRMPEGVIKTRDGNVIKLEKLLDEAESRALAVIQEGGTEMSEAEQQVVARQVGIGAVKYADLSHNPSSVVTFTWEKAMALDGNSGPYLQYAHARIASVQDKYAEAFPDETLLDHPICLGEPIERKLALRLLRFGDVVRKAADQYKPNQIADYLYDLAQVYSSFYQTTPFLKAEKGTRESRVRLCAATARVLKTGLELLGIEAPERI